MLKTGEREPTAGDAVQKLVDGGVDMTDSMFNSVAIAAFFGFDDYAEGVR